MNIAPTVLLIDDEFDIRENFAGCLKRNIKKKSIEFKTAFQGTEGMQIILQNNQQGKETLAFIDIILDDISGEKIVETIKPNPANTRGILISAHKSLLELEEIQRKVDWITNCYEKPITDEIIIREIGKFINQPDISKFDYNSFDKPTADLIKNETNRIRLIMQKTADNIIEIGGSLHKVKQKLEHGKFTCWIESELGIDYGSASNFMRVWDTFRHRREEIAKFGLNVTVLYLMSGRNTPEEFRDEVFRRAEMGNPFSVAEAKQARKEYLERSKIQQEQEILASQTKLPGEEITTTIDVQSSPIGVQSSSNSTPSYQKTQQKSSKPSREKKNNVTAQATLSTKEAIPTDNSPTSSKKDIPSKTPVKKNSPQIISVIPKQKIWKLKNHVLYCGLPNSEEFKNLLPSSVSLNIGFPNFSDWKKEDLFPIQAKTTIVHHTFFPKENEFFLLIAVKNSVEYLTQGGESVILSFLPDPNLLLLIEKLECQSFIAEPDPQKCQETIARWKQYELDGKFPFLDEELWIE